MAKLSLPSIQERSPSQPLRSSSENRGTPRLSTEGYKDGVKDKIGKIFNNENPKKEARSRFSVEQRSNHLHEIQDKRGALLAEKEKGRTDAEKEAIRKKYGAEPGNDLYADGYYADSLEKAKEKALAEKKAKSSLLGLKGTRDVRLTAEEEHAVHLQAMRDFKESEGDLWKIYSERGLSFKKDGTIDWKADPDLVLAYHEPGTDSQSREEVVRGSLQRWVNENPAKAEIYRYLGAPLPLEQRAVIEQEAAQKRQTEVQRNSPEGQKQRLAKLKEGAEIRKQKRVESKIAVLNEANEQALANLEARSSSMTDSELEVETAKLQAKMDSVESDANREIRIDDRFNELRNDPKNKLVDDENIRFKATQEIDDELNLETTEKKPKDEPDVVRDKQQGQEAEQKKSKELGAADNIRSIDLAMQWSNGEDRQDRENADSQAVEYDKENGFDGKFITMYSTWKVVVGTAGFTAEQFAAIKKGMAEEQNKA